MLTSMESLITGEASVSSTPDGEAKTTSQTQRILGLLKVKRRATNLELNRICWRYAARVHELRREGHKILTERLKRGVYEYIYIGGPDEEN